MALDTWPYRGSCLVFGEDILTEKIMEEVWKDIPRYEGKYCVSNTGKVKSLFRMVRHRLGGMKSVPERILKPDGDGYKRRYRSVMFGDRKRMLVHRLVAIAFSSGE